MKNVHYPVRRYGQDPLQLSSVGAAMAGGHHGVGLIQLELVAIDVATICASVDGDLIGTSSLELELLQPTCQEHHAERLS